MRIITEKVFILKFFCVPEMYGLGHGDNAVYKPLFFKIVSPLETFVLP
jgi:hypothetical protein